MSTRAIRKLRGDAALLIPQVSSNEGDDSQSSNDDDDDILENAGGVAATKPDIRLLQWDDDDDDDEEESSSEEERSNNARQEQSVARKTAQMAADETSTNALLSEAAHGPHPPAAVEEEEDFDAILSEFQSLDVEKSIPDDETQRPPYYDVILNGIEHQYLDIDYSIRTSLRGDSTVSSSNATASRSRKNRPALLFGPPREGWTRPPHYVGGGIGMTTYDQNPRPLPWPYSDTDLARDEDERQTWMDAARWFSFIYSDHYMRELEDYETIQRSGDINALVLFVAHHPFVTEALQQLTQVLYQTNHSQEGLSLLRRCLFVLESSALLSFTRGVVGTARLDFDQQENVVFFKALHTLAQVANIAGLPRTALSVCRWLLSLDPLRDPMGVLLMLDHFALSSQREDIDQWLKDLVESDRVRIWYRDPQYPEQAHSSGLLDLPNWAYSYALALYRVSQDDRVSVHLPGAKEKANEAIQSAMTRYPNLVGMLLQGNDVDTTGRSFRRDWVKVLDFLSNHERTLQYEWTSSSRGKGGMETMFLMATLQTADLVGRIFVKQNTRLWSSDSVQQWMYDNLVQMQSGTLDVPAPPNTAIIRYSKANPADFDSRFPQLPPEANIIDPNIVAHALAVEPNRGRFLRRQARQEGDEDMDQNHPWMAAGNVFAGPPTNVVDPDWPMLEVFWRSFLPWNRVEGVPPPRR